MSNRAEIEVAIREAFAGVQLGNGISLMHAKAIDRYYEGLAASNVDAWSPYA